MSPLITALVAVAPDFLMALVKAIDDLIQANGEVTARVNVALNIVTPGNLAEVDASEAAATARISDIKPPAPS